ncbi:MAG TPA: SDR family NAD(P)-dependent oxidoreductase, partial [Tepidisphaeraceae bacterium]|nr:SDR family NAD(P)-dependent oxidoreductase [Tepidisphaeraceae bacterium]
MGYLHGKNVLVTGSSRGIGRAIAQRLAREGAAVGVTYAGNAEKARQVVGEIEAGGGRAFATQADMRDLGQVRAMFDAAAERLGPLDVFVHNAAGVNVFKPTADMTVDDYDSMFLITRGCYFALQEAARRLRDG